MAEPQVFFPADKTEILEIALRIKAMGYRFGQMHCVKTAAEMFIIYTFEKQDLTIEQYRLETETDGTAPSISGVFLPAALYENEISELYGVNFTGLALDFGGTLYETAKPRAFAEVAEQKAPARKAAAAGVAKPATAAAAAAGEAPAAEKAAAGPIDLKKNTGAEPPAEEKTPAEKEGENGDG
jgi:hypothetical protein